MSPWKRATILMAMEFAGSVLVTLNIRGLAVMDYWMVGITDTILAIMVFTSIRLIVEATGWIERTFYVLGAVVGTQVAMYYSRFW
jgi:hypothetical protein